MVVFLDLIGRRDEPQLTRHATATTVCSPPRRGMSCFRGSRLSEEANWSCAAFVVGMVGNKSAHLTREIAGKGWSKLGNMPRGRRRGSMSTKSSDG